MQLIMPVNEPTAKVPTRSMIKPMSGKVVEKISEEMNQMSTMIALLFGSGTRSRVRFWNHLSMAILAQNNNRGYVVTVLKIRESIPMSTTVSLGS